MSVFHQAVAIQVGVAVLLALGFWLVANAGRYAFGHAGFMSIGAYSASILTVERNWNLWLALPAAAISAAIAGALIGLVALRLSLLHLAILTFVFAELIATLLDQWDLVGGASGYVGMHGTTVFMTWICVAVIVVFLALFARSRFGLSSAVIREDSLAAQASGVPTTRVMVKLFALSAAVTGVAGAVSAHFLMFIRPDDFGPAQSMVIVLYVVFGGAQFFWGAAAGAIVLSLLPIYIDFLDRWYTIVYGSLFMVLMIVRPQGIIGRARP